MELNNLPSFLKLFEQLVFSPSLFKVRLNPNKFCTETIASNLPSFEFHHNSVQTNLKNLNLIPHLLKNYFYGRINSIYDIASFIMRVYKPNK